MPDRYIVSKIPDTQLPNNAIQTTKYNVITFIPKNLMEQFSKLANVYFLVVYSNYNQDLRDLVNWYTSNYTSNFNYKW